MANLLVTILVAANSFFVSPAGSDANPGTLAAPYATLGRAQAAMQGSAIKTAYIRPGTFQGVSIILTSADSGETWSYYPGDAYDAAVLDGGASSPTTGGNPITVDGASNVTINGLTIQNCQQFCVGIHGGPHDPLYRDASRYPFPNDVPSVTGVNITNNIMQNVHMNIQPFGVPGGAIFQDGQVENSNISNDVVMNTDGGGICVVSFVAGAKPWPNYDYSGLVIANNAILNTSITYGDSGAIYLIDPMSVSTNSTIRNNFIRDWQGTNSIGNPNQAANFAIYLDDATENVTARGNIIGPTGNTRPGVYTQMGTTAFFFGSARNITATGNIVDLGTTSNIVNAAFTQYFTTNPPMTGNIIAGNIFIGNWTGPQNAYGEGQGPYAYPAATANPVTTPLIQHNLYYNYGGGGMSTTGNLFSDTGPVTGLDPLISGPTYTLAANSPAYALPVNFPPIVGGWGPPGYVIPATGTPPSSPH